MTQTKTLSVFAPAKLNLFLHVTGKLPNGYHTLDSLVAFVDIGDVIHIEEYKHFQFDITGDFAKDFHDKDKGSYIDSTNLVVRAVKALSDITNNPPNIKITLEKNLPLASGLGGGSSDAASVIWGLSQLWNLDLQADYLLPLMTRLGADVPVCLNCSPTIMRGIGEQLYPAPSTMPETPIVLINPNIHCSTPEIFTRHDRRYKQNTTLPGSFYDIYDFVETLKHHENDLYAPAIQIAPEIENVIHALNTQNGSLLARMSGSGASCFGIFESDEQAENAAQNIRDENPDWWIKTGTLNRPERY